mgnify:CR=1 FL=1
MDGHGSSPLTRGARRCAGSASVGSRLIPAHAGSTIRATGGPFRSGAHPRSRGEHGSSTVEQVRADGSSPLTRGARRPSRWGRCCPRLIPAHAGSTTRRSIYASLRGAHPRSRGEHDIARGPWERVKGSSPLTRGAPRSRRRDIAGNRLIPAHAGSTITLSRAKCFSPAHPRSRGEHAMVTGYGELSEGSSPLTRGAHPPTTRGTSPVRLIPAHAGSTRSTVMPHSCTAAHPRSRGEHFVVRREVASDHGSSPLTRGAPKITQSSGSNIRLIPAHAGSTIL